jgi:hypothetical protein
MREPSPPAPPGANAVTSLEWEDRNGTTRQAEFKAASIPAALLLWNRNEQ